MGCVFSASFLERFLVDSGGLFGMVFGIIFGSFCEQAEMSKIYKNTLVFAQFKSSEASVRNSEFDVFGSGFGDCFWKPFGSRPGDENQPKTWEGCSKSAFSALSFGAGFEGGREN